MLKFSKANTKIKQLANCTELQPWLQSHRKVYSLDLLSGHSCPFAKNCLSKVKMENGKRKVHDGPHTEFRCFSASQEALYTTTYTRRKENYDALKSCKPSEMADLIQSVMPKNLGICRIHVAGDFFSQAYFDAWMTVARSNPDRLFYGYTKSLKYWIRRIEDLPENLVLTASYGGREDHLILEYGLRSAIVVYSEKEAADQYLAIDHDDSHAAIPAIRESDFALLIHGVQPQGSKAAIAISQLKADNVQFSYGKK